MLHAAQKRNTTSYKGESFLSGLGELEVDVLSGELLVDTREGVELVLEGSGILLVEEAERKGKRRFVNFEVRRSQTGREERGKLTLG
jgi:hypothetical protein